MAFNHVGNCNCPIGCCDCGSKPEDTANFFIGQKIFYMQHLKWIKRLKKSRFKLIPMTVLEYEKRTGLTSIEHDSGLRIQVHSSRCRKTKAKEFILK